MERLFFFTEQSCASGCLLAVHDSMALKLIFNMFAKGLPHLLCIDMSLTLADRHLLRMTGRALRMRIHKGMVEMVPRYLWPRF